MIKKVFSFILIVTVLVTSTLLSHTVHAIAGDAQWAKSTTSNTSSAGEYRDVVIGDQDYIYVAGQLYNSEIVDFGNGVTTSGGVASGSNGILVKYNNFGVPIWASTTGVGSTTSTGFTSVARDSNDNLYVVGSLSSAGSVDFGNGVTLLNSRANNSHILIVKYNSSGVAQWARTVSSNDFSNSMFTGIAIDSLDNITVSGSLAYSGASSVYNFGNGVTIDGSLLPQTKNPLIVRYNTSGEAQWAHSVVSGPGTYSGFDDVAVGPDGSCYVVGDQSGIAQNNYGNGVTVSGAFAFNNLTIVKYSSTGIPLWGHSVDPAPSNSYFNSVAVDSNGNIYASGTMNGIEDYGFGSGISLHGAIGVDLATPILIRYTPEGDVVWATTMSSGPESTEVFGQGVNIDQLDNIYLSGASYGEGTYNFGNGVSYTIANPNGDGVPFLTKYNTDGVPQSVKTPASSLYIDAYFNRFAFTSTNDVIVVGSTLADFPLDFGNGIVVSGVNPSYYNPLILSYEGVSTPVLSTPTPTPTTSGSSESPKPDGETSTTEAPSCNDQVASAPDLFQVDRSATSATVHFAPLSDSVSSYLISYGTDSTAEGYSLELPISHADGAVSQSINALNPSTTYSFKVRAQKGCMPGDWSSVKEAQSSSSYSPSTTAPIYQSTPSTSSKKTTTKQPTKKTLKKTTKPTKKKTLPSNTKINKPWFKLW